MNVKYCVENPNTDHTKYDQVKLIEVTVDLVDNPVVTKTRQMGLAVVATIKTSKDKTFQGHAVCVPQDAFSFKTGGKIALRRALQKSPYKQKSRTSIWYGFFKALGLEF